MQQRGNPLDTLHYAVYISATIINLETALVWI